MSRPPWQAMLAEMFGSGKAIARVAIVGVGHELRGDDAAGLVVVRGLQRVPADEERLLVLDAGSAPENQTGPLRRFKPDIVLLIDAAQMNETPGTVRWLPWGEVGGVSAFTHALPLHVLARYLSGELGCEVALLCVQPEQDDIGAPLSPAVRQATDAIRDALAQETKHGDM
jgi:hydrogenase 3 maturation protease